MFARGNRSFNCGTARDPWAGASHARSATEWRKARLRRGSQAVATTEVVAIDALARTRKEARLEAVLFVAETALSARKLAQGATLADAKEARELVDRLNAAYQRSQSSFRVECVAGGYRLLTRPEFAPWLDKLHDRKAEVQLSAPAMETLTIVAYRQPVTRADIEAIRGVQSTEILKVLMEKGLVRITGEDDSLGRPYLYGTTNQFLESFGLSSLKELPLREEFEIKPDANNEEQEAEELLEEEHSETDQSDQETIGEAAADESSAEEISTGGTEPEETEVERLADAEELVDDDFDDDDYDEDDYDEDDYDDEEEDELDEEAA